MSIENFFKNDQEKREFALWAFGKRGTDIRVDQTLKYWNKRHGDKFLLKVNDKISETLPKMLDIWRSCSNEQRNKTRSI